MQKDNSGILEEEVLLAMDLASYHSGWALFKGETLFLTGCIKSKPNTPMKDRALLMYGKLMGLLKQYEPVHFVIEDQFLNPIHRNARTLKTLSKFAGIALVCSALFGLEMEDLAPTEVKKLMTGTGNAKKEDVIRAVEEQFGLETTNDNIADAVAVGAAWLRKRKSDALRMSASAARDVHRDTSENSVPRRRKRSKDDADGNLRSGGRSKRKTTKSDGDSGDHPPVTTKGRHGH